MTTHPIDSAPIQDIHRRRALAALNASESVGDRFALPWPERLERAAQSLADEMPGEGWQEIKGKPDPRVAPWDGKPILAINTRLPNDPPMVVRYFRGETFECRSCGTESIGNEEHWADPPNGYIYRVNINFFDYWQPLPPPPAEEIVRRVKRRAG